MTIIAKDPLLAVAQTLLLIAQVVLLVAAAALAAAIPVLLVGRGQIAARLEASLGATAGTPLATLLAIVALALAIVALMWLFVRHLRRIIGTVAEGDPFVHANADRLGTMGWIAVGVQVLSIGIGLLALTLPDAAKEPLGPDAFNIAVTADSFSLDGVVLILVLFILARVFRKGAEMRTDLEGTV
ncbi:DUF2975 domain-containing protein [Porphyrobacter sp. GA68]|uniref:DUF2975 domain-containing protein n=1 Tax=Porphyrobacter sp. GA68 TaxID=2883480 RepID=UPI001D17FFF3|nr:DUF2975 domain-containing protein [Porphyrobacter sp. GA68]